MKYSFRSIDRWHCCNRCNYNFQMKTKAYIQKKYNNKQNETKIFWCSSCWHFIFINTVFGSKSYNNYRRKSIYLFEYNNHLCTYKKKKYFRITCLRNVKLCSFCTYVYMYVEKTSLKKNLHLWLTALSVFLKLIDFFGNQTEVL